LGFWIGEAKNKKVISSSAGARGEIGQERDAESSKLFRQEAARQKKLPPLTTRSFLTFIASPIRSWREGRGENIRMDLQGGERKRGSQGEKRMAKKEF